jgi:hypothetical protein
MKLILTTLLLLSIAIGADKEETDDSSTAVIAHEMFESPEAFRFGETFYLDIDKDGTSDFQFTTVNINKEGSIHTKYLVNTLGENELLTVDGAVAISNEGAAIQAWGNEAWSKDSGEIIEQVFDGSSEKWTGTWSGDRDQYIGIKLVKGENSYEGWVNVSINQEKETAFVHGYGINRNPNGAISAGQL